MTWNSVVNYSFLWNITINCVHVISSTHIFNGHKIEGSPLDFLTNYHCCNLPLFAYFTIGYAMKFQLPPHPLQMCILMHYSCYSGGSFGQQHSYNLYGIFCNFWHFLSVLCLFCISFIQNHEQRRGLKGTKNTSRYQDYL